MNGTDAERAARATERVLTELNRDKTPDFERVAAGLTVALTRTLKQSEALLDPNEDAWEIRQVRLRTAALRDLAETLAMLTSSYQMLCAMRAERELF